MHQNVDWIREGLAKPGKTRTGLARALGRSPSAVTALLRGQRELKAREIEVVARYLDADPPVDNHRQVPLVGYVGAGAEAHYYADAQGPFDMVPAPDGSTESTVAVEIRGESLGSFFDHWLVFYDDVRAPVTADLIGKLCVVGLIDDRILIKKLQRSRAAGYYHLLSQTEDPILDAEVLWAARVKNMVPR